MGKPENRGIGHWQPHAGSVEAERVGTVLGMAVSVKGGSLFLCHSSP